MFCRSLLVSVEFQRHAFILSCSDFEEKYSSGPRSYLLVLRIWRRRTAVIGTLLLVRPTTPHSKGWKDGGVVMPFHQRLSQDSLQLFPARHSLKLDIPIELL